MFFSIFNNSIFYSNSKHDEQNLQRTNLAIKQKQNVKFGFWILELFELNYPLFDFTTKLFDFSEYLAI
jgi:hypothetical protein